MKLQVERKRLLVRIILALQKEGSKAWMHLWVSIVGIFVAVTKTMTGKSKGRQISRVRVIVP